MAEFAYAQRVRDSRHLVEHGYERVQKFGARATIAGRAEMTAAPEPTREELHAVLAYAEALTGFAQRQLGLQTDDILSQLKSKR